MENINGSWANYIILSVDLWSFSCGICHVSCCRYLGSAEFLISFLTAFHHQFTHVKVICDLHYYSEIPSTQITIKYIWDVICDFNNHILKCNVECKAFYAGVGTRDGAITYLSSICFRECTAFERDLAKISRKTKIICPLIHNYSLKKISHSNGVIASE